MDQLGLVQAVDGLGQGVVVTATTAAHRRLNACLGQTLGVANADVLDGFNRSSQHRVALRIFRYSFSASAGVFQPNVLRGLLFKVFATA